MLRNFAIIFALFALAVFCFGATLFQENFTGGTTENEWKALGDTETPVNTAYNDNIQVVPVSSVPGGVAPPGNTTGYVGAIQDVDNSYLGIAAAYATATAGLTDLIYETQLYCYDAAVNGANPQGGPVARITDTTHYVRFYANLAADNLHINAYTGAWDTTDWTDATSGAGWHKVKMKIEGDQMTIWFDNMDTPLAGCPITVPELADPLTNGYIGVSVLHYLASAPVAIYFDQILVTDLAGPTIPTPTPTPYVGAAVTSSWAIYE
jgi:hypothetical protein